MPLPPFLSSLLKETGLPALLHSPKDVHLLLLTRTLRMFAYGSSTLILALLLSLQGHSDAQIGIFMTLTLVGDVGISLALSIFADALGRRKILVLGAGLMALSGAVFATARNYWILLFAAVVGVISPSGNEIGPFRAVEESTLAHLSEAGVRTEVFAWYVVCGTLGAAGGTFVCGWVTQALQGVGWSEESSFRFIFWVYALIGLVKAGMSLRLSRKCEVQVEVEVEPPRERGERDSGVEQARLMSETGHDSDGEDEPARASTPRKTTMKPKISEKSRIVLIKLCGLFFFDSLASGMIPGSLIAYYLERKFSTLPRGKLGTIIASSQFVSSLGNIFASSVAKRIGLVRTMVFTHLPSAIFLALIPAPSSLILTILLLIARSSLSSMDQAPRSAFLSAVVLPEERTAVMGIVNTVKTLSQSAGPTFTGLLAGGNRFWIAFVIAGSLKASYDVAMLTMFANTPLEGEDRRQQNTNQPSESRENSAGEFALDDMADDESTDDDPQARTAK